MENSSLMPPVSLPIVGLSPPHRATNIADSIAVIVQNNVVLDALDDAVLRELGNTVQLTRFPSREAVDFTTRIERGNPLWGDNVISVDLEILNDGWYELRAGPLDGLRWGPGAGFAYELSQNQTAAVRFRVGSAPEATYVLVCNAPDGSGSKVYVNLSERARLHTPMSEHVAMRTERGSVSCRSLSDEDRTDPLDYDSLNFFCEDIRKDDLLTVTLNDAFSSLATPDSPVPASTTEFVIDMEHPDYVDPCGYFVVRDIDD
jgi:hypothetical protein